MYSNNSAHQKEEAPQNIPQHSPMLLGDLFFSTLEIQTEPAHDRGALASRT